MNNMNKFSISDIENIFLSDGWKVMVDKPIFAEDIEEVGFAFKYYKLINERCYFYSHLLIGSEEITIGVYDSYNGMSAAGKATLTQLNNLKQSTGLNSSVSYFTSAVLNNYIEELFMKDIEESVDLSCDFLCYILNDTTIIHNYQNNLGHESLNLVALRYRDNPDINVSEIIFNSENSTPSLKVLLMKYMNELSKHKITKDTLL